jgi:DNA-binding PadR family transcriptional regulator
MTGYDRKKFFDVSVGHFWSYSEPHLQSLNDLEAQGWVDKQVIPSK